MSRPLSPHEAMRIAIDEARRGLGFVAPNPPVGCVILDRKNHLLAKGYHREVGTDHAEIAALKKISNLELLNGAHLYVTLEPCAHFGRTPPCADKLATLPLAAVTYGLKDPDPRTAGQGAARIAGKGIAVHSWNERVDLAEDAKAQMIEELEELAEIFLHCARKQSPFVAVKVATSLDGKMAMTSGESKWITGETALRYSHVLRAQHDAVLIGRRTFVTDNPSLNIRHQAFLGKKNIAIVLDPQGKILSEIENSQISKVREAKDIFVIVAPGFAKPSPMMVLECPLVDGGFEVDRLLDLLWRNGIRSVLVEGGAQTIGLFVDAKRAQRLHLFMAPVLLGGRHGLSWSQGFGGSTMSDRQVLRSTKSMRLGVDHYFTSRLP